jgi:hypothetical protein
MHRQASTLEFKAIRTRLTLNSTSKKYFMSFTVFIVQFSALFYIILYNYYILFLLFNNNI